MKYLFVFLTLITGMHTMASDIEEPKWTLIDEIDGIELRQYAPSIRATTVLASSGATTAGFQRLAGYIFGGNNTGQSIAMTAPVEETLTTAEPVMAFTMPARYAESDLPVPDDDRVSLHSVPERTIAAIRFSGWATSGKVSRKSAALMAVLEQQGITPIGLPTLNQYNPPWTAPFLRRNEIMVEVAFEGLASNQ